MKTLKLGLEQLFKNGCKDPKKLSKLCGMALSTAYKKTKKLREGLSLKRKPGSGRPRIFTSQDKQRLAKLVHRDDMKSSSDLKIEMESLGTPNVTSRTIRNYLHRAGFKNLTPSFKPLLTQAHKQKRMEWCQKHIRTRWHNWIFTDESRFQLYTNKVGRWCKQRPSIGKPKLGPAIMVWGGISSKGKTDLQIIKGTIDSAKYQQILATAQPSIQKLFPKGSIFQQDGASCHTSKSTKLWFGRSKWKVSDWPAQSPDLNPIKNVWGLMKKEVEKKRPTNIAQLLRKFGITWPSTTWKISSNPWVKERSVVWIY